MNREERDAAEEIASHLAERAAELEAAGATPTEAARRARVEFGNPTLIHEDSRAVWRWRWLDELRRDVAFAWRWMRKSPGFSAVAILSLAAGIGANTAIFSVVKALVLEPLPYRDASRLVYLWTDDPVHGVREEGVGYLTIQDWRQRNRSFEDIGICGRGDSVILSALDPPQQAAGELVSGNMFSILGTPPALGRWIDQRDETEQRRVVVLSYRVWQRLFGANAQAIGRLIEIRGIPHEVIGVMPPQFFFPSEKVDFWRPISLDEHWAREQKRRYTDWWRGVARLKPGVSIEKAREDMRAVGLQLEREYHVNDPDFAGFGVNVVPALIQVVGAKTPLLMTVLTAAAVVLLLIACANVGQLLLARSSARQHEFAVRRALGAGRARLMRQLLAESLLLAGMAAAAGVAIAFGGLRSLLAFAPAGIPRLASVAIDTNVLLFTAAVSVFGSVMLGIGPALNLSRDQAAGAVRESSRGSSPGVSRARVRNVLVGSQFALGFLLLLTALLLVRSYARVRAADTGFAPDHLLVVRVMASKADKSMPGFYTSVLERVKGLPGVVAAGATRGMLLEWNPDDNITVEGAGPEIASHGNDPLDGVAVGPGFFTTMRVPLLRGRYLADGDSHQIVIGAEMAARYWSGQDPVGRRFKHGPLDSNKPWLTVVGVVAGVRRQGRETAAIPEYYYLQWNNIMDLVIRTKSDPLQLAAAVRSEVRAADRAAVVFSISTAEQKLDELMAPRRFETLLLTLFSVLATLLAAIGIYGTTHYAVSERVRELGIRLALGARGPAVLRLMVVETLRPAAIGIVLGLAGAFAIGRTLSSLLYETAPLDPVYMVAVVAALLALGMGAALLPARRAVRIDPVTALRAE